VIDSLPDQTVVQNTVGGPGGEGSFLMVPRKGSFSDGVLEPRKSSKIPLVMCINERRPVELAVTVLGAVLQ